MSPGSRRPRILSGLLMAAALTAAAGYFAWHRHRLAQELLSALPSPSLDSLEAPLAAALERLREDVQQRPLDAETWGRLAMSLHIHQYYRPALVAYDAALKLRPGLFRWVYLRAMLLQALDDPEAGAALLAAESLRPDFAPAQWRLGQLLLLAGRFDEAKNHFRSALILNPQGYPARVALAQAYAAQDSLAEADSQAREAVAEFPNFREAHALLGDLRRRSGGAPDSARVERLPSFGSFPDPYEDSITAMGVTSYWHYNRALRLIRKGRWREAALEFRIVADVRPRVSAFVSLAEALGRAGAFPEAEREARRGLDRFPGSPDLANAMGFLCALQKKYEEALPWYQMAMAGAPNDPSAYRNLTIALIEAERFEDARRHCDASLARFPADEPLIHHCGEIDEAAKGPPQ